MQFTQYNHWSRRFDNYVAPVQEVKMITPPRKFACMPVQAIALSPVQDLQYSGSSDIPFGFYYPGPQLQQSLPCKNTKDDDFLWGVVGFMLGQIVFRGVNVILSKEAK